VLKVFKELFDALIDEKHGGFKATDKHPPPDLDSAKVTRSCVHLANVRSLTADRSRQTPVRLTISRLHRSLDVLVRVIFLQCLDDRRRDVTCWLLHDRRRDVTCWYSVIF